MGYAPTISAVTLGMLLLGPAIPAVGLTAEESCQLGRIKATAVYAECVQKRIKAYYALTTPGMDKCVAKYASAYDKLRARAASSPAVETCDAPRFVDNGNGTVTDNLSGLVWEQKLDSPGSIHHYSDLYNWSSSDGIRADGTVFTTFLSTLNSACFADECDWRLPTLVELLAIGLPTLGLCTVEPCIDPAFGVTLVNAAHRYWTGTTFSGSDTLASSPVQAWTWTMDFTLAGPGQSNAPKLNLGPARAVRGGF